jgi:hypothetical protein
VLVGTPRLAGKDAAPQRWLDLRDSRAPDRNVPAVERPEMHPLSKLLADEAQPGNAGVGRFRHRTLHVEMKNRFCAARALFGQRRQRALPVRAASLPHTPSRTKST